MLIACPNCKKKFDIDDRLVAEEKKLRCSNCRAVFRLVRKAPASAMNPAPAQAPAPSQAPAPAAAQTAAQAAPVAPVQSPSPSGRGAGVREEPQPQPLQPQARPAAPSPAAPATAAPASTMVRPEAPAPAPAAPVAGRIKVVVANESAAFCEAVRKVVASEPFELFVCTDGKEALDTVEQTVPHLLLLDVALPTMFGFEVCERVRANPRLAGVKIVLIASIYDKTRYKRSPNSLYGADDYLEKHHIPDSLVPMIYRLVSGSAPLPTAPSTAELALQEKSRAEIRQDEVAQTQAVPAAAPVAAPAAAPAARQPELSEAHLKAKRLARIIVSDISLYSQAKVEQGVREGNFHTVLADDIREGELLYRQRVPESVRESTSYLTEAFDDLIAKKRAELRM